MDPIDIAADRAAGTLTIAWSDGHRSVYSLPDLRWACPCATCAGEWGRPGRLAGITVLPDDELRLADLRMVGAYGVTPEWASGHASGIYSFELLRELCSCGVCRARGAMP